MCELFSPLVWHVVPSISPPEIDVDLNHFALLKLWTNRVLEAKKNSTTDAAKNWCSFWSWFWCEVLVSYERHDQLGDFNPLAILIVAHARLSRGACHTSHRRSLSSSRTWSFFYDRWPTIPCVSQTFPAVPVHRWTWKKAKVQNINKTWRQDSPSLSIIPPLTLVKGPPPVLGFVVVVKRSLFFKKLLETREMKEQVTQHSLSSRAFFSTDEHVTFFGSLTLLRDLIRYTMYIHKFWHSKPWCRACAIFQKLSAKKKHTVTEKKNPCYGWTHVQVFH